MTLGPDRLIAGDRLPSGGAGGSGGDGWARRLRAEHFPALAPFAIDPLGCGDALLTAATLSLASGGSLRAAAFLGAVAASVQAQRLGNLPVSGADLRHAVARLHAAHLAYTPAEVVESRGVRSPGRVAGVIDGPVQGPVHGTVEAAAGV